MSRRQKKSDRPARRSPRRLLTVLALGAGVAAVAKRLQGGGAEPVWHSRPGD